MKQNTKQTDMNEHQLPIRGIVKCRCSGYSSSTARINPESFRDV